MNVIGLDSEEQYSILRMLAIILWLGNVQFDEQDDGNAKIADTGVSDFVAYLMETGSALVEKVLTTRVVETQRGGRRGKSIFTSSLILTDHDKALCTMYH
jgi:myosin-1